MDCNFRMEPFLVFCLYSSVQIAQVHPIFPQTVLSAWWGGEAENVSLATQNCACPCNFGGFARAAFILFLVPVLSFHRVVHST